MELTVLGSGTVVPEGDRVCASYYVEAEEIRLLLDCGPGSLHHMARFGVPWQRLTHLALTHFHTDHIGGLPILFFSLKHGLAPARTEPLDVIGPTGTGALFKRLASAFGDYLLDPGFPVRVREIGTGDHLALGGDVALRAHATPHTAESVAYRLEAGEAGLGYTGDTGASEDLGDFLRGLDVLIAECSLPDEHGMETHLTPSKVAALARAASPGRLVLTHIYPQLPRAEAPARVREAGWEGETIVAEDGLRLRVAGEE